jgi:hypothetical protein
MRVVNWSLVLALLAGLALVPRVASAQAGALSDSLSETAVDSAGVPIPLAPPPIFVTIPEVTPEPAGPILIPSRVIDFLEPTGVSQSVISDRLTIGQPGQSYALGVISDDDPGGLPSRASSVGSTLIPASAREAFQPIRIEAFSDGDPNFNGVSDTLTITLGYYGPGTGLVIKGSIPEPTPEVPTETPLSLTIPPTFFDIEEPSLTGGSTGIISDYVDIPQAIVVTFLSSDDPAAYEGLPIGPSGFVMETLDGGGVVYALNFRSDTEVPEPASFALLGVALLAATLFGQRRRIG